MAMKHILGWALAGSVAWAGTALAQQSLAIIELQHRSAQDVLPVLVPLVEPGGSLSGFDYKLFLRASPANREEIRRALSALDTPPRRLRIEVSQNRSSADSQSGWAGSGQIVIRRERLGGRGEVTGWNDRGSRSVQGSQFVQTLDGGEAYIHVGYSVPVALRQVWRGPRGVRYGETIEYRDLGDGFYAVPSVRGDMVSVDISQHSDRAGRYGAGSAEVAHLATTVSGRLGEWIALGGSDIDESSRDGGFARSSRDSRRNHSTVWLRVTEMP